MRDFKPDLVLRDETDLGTTIAAELLEVPVASHVVLAAGLLLRPELVAPRLDAVRVDHGLPRDPQLTRLTSGLVLTNAAPSFRSPQSPLQLQLTHYRSAVPPRATSHDGRTRIYVTLGTIFNNASGDLFERILTGLGALDVDVVATVGRGTDPADLGPQPARVRVERFLPQDEILPCVALVVSHGGSGSLMATLAHGTPSLLLPLGADQPHNARRAVELGVAAALDAVTVKPDEVAARASQILADSAMRERCLAIAGELSTLEHGRDRVGLRSRQRRLQHLHLDPPLRGHRRHRPIQHPTIQHPTRGSRCGTRAGGGHAATLPEPTDTPTSKNAPVDNYSRTEIRPPSPVSIRLARPSLGYSTTEEEAPARPLDHRRRSARSATRPPRTERPARLLDHRGRSAPLDCSTTGGWTPAMPVKVRLTKGRNSRDACRSRGPEWTR